MVINIRTLPGLALFQIFCASPVSGKSDPMPDPVPAQGPDTDAEIIVIGRRERGDIIGRGVPDLRIQPDEIASYGSSTVTELLENLTPQIGERPVLLVNGQRILGVSDIGQLPPEAIERVDVFPENVALTYGERADKRVVNIVLRARFNALTAETRARFATAGGRSQTEANLNYVRINTLGRLNLGLSYGRDTTLFENERDLISGDGGLFDPLGNISALVAGTEIDPALSAVAGTSVIVVGVPKSAATGTSTLDAFASGANVPNASDLSRYRTLLPGGRTLGISATFNRTIFGSVSATLDTRWQSSDANSAFGLPSLLLTLPSSNGFSPFANDVMLYRAPDTLSPLRGETSTRTSHIGLALNGRVAPWTISLNAAYDRFRSMSRNDRGIDQSELQARLDANDPEFNPFAPILGASLTALEPDLATSTSSSSAADLLVNGPLVPFPAGSVSATFTAGIASRDLDSRAVRAGASQVRDISSVQSKISISLDIPIASRRNELLAALGELSANVNVSRDVISDVGSADGLGYGLNWSPMRSLKLAATVTTTGGLPPVAQRGDPLLVTPNVPTFDFTTGQTVAVTRLDGGNPLLRANNRRSFLLRARYTPVEDTSLTLDFSYTSSRTRDLVGGLPAATPEVEAAFPERFVRDDLGRLISIDARRVNFARASQRQINWGLFYTLPIGGTEAAPGLLTDSPAGASREEGSSRRINGFNPRAGRLLFALNHVWRLRDKLLIRPGLPVLDLLNGDTIGGRGQSRHSATGRINFLKNGLGLALDGQWQSGSTARSGTTVLNFSGRSTVNLKLFADLGQLGFLSQHKPWLARTRLSLDINNLFDSRTRVSDASGATPLSYQSSFLDPLGQSIRVEIRKQF